MVMWERQRRERERGGERKEGREEESEMKVMKGWAGRA